MEVPSSCTLVSAVHVRPGLAHLGGEDLDCSLPHGKGQADIANHRGNHVGTVPLVGRDIDGPAHCAGAGDYPLLPCRAEAFTPKTPSVRSLDTICEQVLEMLVNDPGPSHHPLPIHALLEGD